MGVTKKRIISIYKFPVILLLMIMIPRVNNLLWFHPHVLPFVGMTLIMLLPLCTPYVILRLFYCLRAEKAFITLDETNLTEKGKRAYRRFGTISFVLYLILLFPLSHLAVASVNWGRAENLRWSPTIFYKVITFPIGPLLPPYRNSSSERLWPLLESFPPSE